MVESVDDTQSFRGRVLHVASAPELGGLQRVLSMLAREQQDHGLEVAAATSPGGGLADQLRRAGFPVLETPMREGLRPRSVLALRRFAADFGADLIHAHGARATLYSYLATRGRSRTALLSHVHLADPWRFDRSMRARVDRFISCRTGAIVACSKNLRTLLVERQGFPPELTRSIPNGIDVTRFSGAQAKERRGSIVIGTCARLELQKGLTHLLDAAAILEADGLDYELRIAGEGSLKVVLEAQAQRLRIASRINWMGFVEDVSGLLSSFDIFVLPSLAEGLPLAILEAMAARVPVIATDIAGTNELVEHERTGLLVPPRDPNALAAAIKRLVLEPETGSRLARSARDLVHAEHSHEAMEVSFRRLYQELCG